MADEYTPTDEQVRTGFYFGAVAAGIAAHLEVDEAEALSMFDRWLAAHDAEVRGERDAALAVIEKAQTDLNEVTRPWHHVFKRAVATLSTVDTSALAVRDAETRRQALLSAAAVIEPDVDPENCSTVYDPWDVGEWLRARAEKGADRG